MLAGFVVVQVLGACGSFKFTTEDRHQKPLVFRYTIDKTSFLHFFFRSYDTIGTEIVYQGRELRPATPCDMGSKHAEWFHPRPISGPDPRWLVESRCPGGTTLYLLRLTADGPVLLPLGPLRYPARARNLVTLPDNRYAYLVSSDSTGVFIDWQAMRTQPVLLPALPRRLSWKYRPERTAYTLSPDARVLARLHSPDTTSVVVVVGGVPTRRRPAMGPGLVIDQYYFETRSAQRQIVNGVYVPPAALLDTVRWGRATDNRWQVQLRP
ncbi:hypothetical protein GCM10023186_02320 [Hymenobacter koreensis]|uniref:Uncharacterized protein n=1 Tax=Hymenobacter koreensis TaxID=1084523 RepID=A0ABP8IU73_9BACT